MLPKRRRLTAAEVREVIAGGKGSRSGLLSLKTLATKGPFRCAVVVSKRVAKSAVKRNSLRRAVYRALGAASLPAVGHAILFVQSAPPKDTSAAAFTADIKKLFHV